MFQTICKENYTADEVKMHNKQNARPYLIFYSTIQMWLNNLIANFQGDSITTGIATITQLKLKLGTFAAIIKK